MKGNRKLVAMLSSMIALLIYPVMCFKNVALIPIAVPYYTCLGVIAPLFFAANSWENYVSSKGVKNAAIVPNTDRPI